MFEVIFIFKEKIVIFSHFSSLDDLFAF